MPTNTFSLEEAYGTEPKAEFPELVPAKRSAPSTGGDKKRAAAIAATLNLDGPRTALIGQEVSEDQNPQKLTQPKPGQKFSLDEAYGPVLGGQPQEAGGGSFLENAGNAIVDTGKAIFDTIKDRLVNPPVRVKRSPDEVEELVNQAMKDPSWGSRSLMDTDESVRERLRKQFQYTDPMSSQESAQIYAGNRDAKALAQQQKFERTKDMPAWQQFLNTLDNPIKLITGQSLPANFASFIAHAPDKERLKYEDFSKHMMRLRIINNPDQYPSEAVEAATAAEKRTQEKQDPTVREQWNALKDSAFDHPGMFAGNLVNSLIADPEMLAAPIGFGSKPIQAARSLATGAETTSKAIQLADKILDTGALGAVINTGISAADQLANSSHISSKELAFSAAAGATIGGTLGGLLSRGAHAKIRNLDDAKLKGTYDDILKDQAAYEIEVERMARGEFDPRITTEMQQRINDSLGITSKTDRDKWIAQRRKEVRSAFKNDSDFADYQQFKAEERIARTEQLATERAEREAAAAKQQAEGDAGGFTTLTPETPSGPSPGEVLRVLRKPGHLHTAEDKLILKSIPKSQRGEVDPRLLARVGAAGVLAAGAYGLAPEDKKVSTAILGGLAGLLIPGGGSVLSRMRQAGAVSADGLIPGLADLVRDGKLKPDIDLSAARAQEAQLLTDARRGDQAAYKKIYEGNFPRITRYVNNFLKQAGPKLGLDAEDVAQEVFIKFFNGLNEFKGDAAIYTYLQSIAKNEALQAVRKAKTLKGGGDYQDVSMYNPGKDAGPGDAAAGHILEGDNSLVKGEVEGASADFESPEFNALYSEAQEKLLNAVKNLPESQQTIFLLNRVEGMTLDEISKKLNVPLNTVKQYAMRAQDSVISGLEKDYQAKPVRDRAYTENTKKIGYRISIGDGAGAKLGNSEGNGLYFFTREAPALKLKEHNPNAKLEKIEYEKPKNPLILPTDEKSPLWDAFDEGLLLDDVNYHDSDWIKFNKEAYQQANKEFFNKYGQELNKHPDGYHIGIQKLLLRAGDILSEKLKAAGYDAVIRNKGKPDEFGVILKDDGYRSSEKRGRGRPRKQIGEVDPKLLKLGAVAALGVGAYNFLDTENKKLAGTIAALGGLALLSKGRTGESLGRGLVNTIDRGLGVTSTRLMNISRPLWWKTIEHYRSVLRDTHKYMQDVDPFLVKLESLKKDQKDFVTRAILTGNPGVANRLIDAIGDHELSAGWRKVRTVLDSIGDQLVHLKRFKNKEVDYFPRIVTDYAGLIKALGNEKGDFLNRIVDDANKKAIRARGTELTELERSLVINKALVSEPKLGGQPGFAKDRTVKEISPELQKYYATPTESLHSYIRSAVEDIERAKYFGKDLEVVTKDGKEYTNVDKSVGKLVDGLLQSGKITEKDAIDTSSMLKSLFLNGERPSNEIIQKAKNLSYAGLLGNPISAAGQLGDAIIQTHIQGLRPTISGVVRSLTGKKFVSMKEFGLADHLAEEFVNTEGTAKFLKRVFKVGLFSQLDTLGKNVGLNAAISNFGKMVKSEGGIQRLHGKYGDVLQPQEFQQLVKDLQKGEVTDLVRSVAFAELSRTQPITRLEMPQAYLDNPNGRLLYQFKTFMLKQMDVFRRDAYNEIKKGNTAKGIKNLVSFATVLGISGATTSQIQNWLRGRDKEFELSDIPMNMLKTFGMSEYILDHMAGVSKEEAARRREQGDTGARTTKAEPFQTTAGLMTPPFKMLDEIVTADPNALRYIPVIGPTLLENYKKRKAEESQ